MASVVSLPQSVPLTGQPPFRVLNGHAFFSGHCEECRPYCAAVCCRGYGFVSLSEEEASSGEYQYKEITEGCKCETCTRMRELGVRYTLRKLPDGSCVYLDGGRRCSIYAKRPETCRRYSCTGVPFTIKPD